MALNIQEAEICSVIFDVYAQFAFKAANNSYSFSFLYSNHIGWHFLYQKLCASSVMFKLYLQKLKDKSLNIIKCLVLVSCSVMLLMHLH